MNAVLFGNLTIDINEAEKRKYTGPGGSVFYLAATLSNLGVSSTIFSPYGADFPKKYLPKTSFIPSRPIFTKTLIFRNDYIGNKRKQRVENYEEYLQYSVPMSSREVPTRNDKIVVIAPVINNIRNEQIRKIKEFFPKRFFCLLPQGFYRKIDKEGTVSQATWDNAHQAVKYFDFVCLSQEDVTDADAKAKKWSMRGPIVAVTRAQSGSSLYQKGERIDTPAYVSDAITDPTGAGDVFAAAFCFTFITSHHIGDSLCFAHAAAGLSLRYKSDKLQYSYRDIINFAAQAQQITL